MGLANVVKGNLGVLRPLLLHVVNSLLIMFNQVLVEHSRC
jgi:hypothetical protein